MKITTITCHRVYNYGASLQAYALQCELESQGHDVTIIDFRPWYNDNRYNVFYYDRHKKGRKETLMNKIPLLKMVILPYLYIRGNKSITWGRKRTFDHFTKYYLKLSKRTYYTSEQLKKRPPLADVYIAGSDQIWNTYCDNGKEPGYYLDFGAPTTKRISYAASLATDEIAPGWSNFVKEKLYYFNAISVREYSSLRILTDIGVKNVTHVLDPVFLLSKDRWIALATKAKKYKLSSNNYVLLYDFIGYDNSIRDFTIKYAKDNNLTIVSINDYSDRTYADININDAGPLEFLNLLFEANCIISNSFHATAFSLLLNKEFFSFPLVDQNNSARITDLLSMVNLANRFLPTGSNYQPINYSIVNKQLLEHIDKSRLFLQNNLWV